MIFFLSAFARRCGLRGLFIHIGLVGLVVMALAVLLGADYAVADNAPPQAKAEIQEAYGKLPLSFEANRGQTDSRVKFLNRGRGYTLFLTPIEAVLAVLIAGTQRGLRAAASCVF